MENVVLQQNKFSITRKIFRLTESGLLIVERKNQKEWEYRVPYEKIGFETVIKKDLANSRAFVAVAVLFVICLAGIASLFVFPPVGKEKSMYVIIPLFTLMMGLMTLKGWLQRNLVYEYITGGEQAVEFLKNEPSVQEYNQFKSALYDRIKGVHKKRMLYDADLNAPIELFEDRIKWLKAIDAIGDEEILDFKRKLQAHRQRHFN